MFEIKDVGLRRFALSECFFIVIIIIIITRMWSFGGQGDGAFPSITRTLQEAGNLTLARLESVDAGLYECVATNSVATIVTSTLLIIERTLSTSQHTFMSIT